MKYIALLRGINVGGHNKVTMADLKRCFEAEGLENVVTYINSGNVIFDSLLEDITTLITISESAIQKEFGFRVVCAVIPAAELRKAVANAPAWWGLEDDNKHNTIFVIPPQTAQTVMKEVGAAKPEYENIAARENVIFWSAPLKTFGRTRYSKIVGTSMYKFITIRNSNTIKRLVELSKD